MDPDIAERAEGQVAVQVSVKRRNQDEAEAKEQTKQNRGTEEFHDIGQKTV